MRYKRQIAMFDPSKHEDTHCVIVGCGNIGSHTALALARMGIQKFMLIDFDEIEEHNLSSQAYLQKDIGREKVKALKEMILAINKGAHVTTRCESFQKTKLPVTASTIFISAVDSMNTRYEMADILEKVAPDNLIIDGRLGGGQFEVHAVKCREWRATLTLNASNDPCGARYISYTSYIIAGCIANTLKRYLQGEKYTRLLLMHTSTYEVIKTMV